eukprot:scaffold8_cov249-Pinguiococcus_pyrenoidosus.AAC.24
MPTEQQNDFESQELVDSILAPHCDAPLAASDEKPNACKTVPNAAPDMTASSSGPTRCRASRPSKRQMSTKRSVRMPQRYFSTFGRVSIASCMVARFRWMSRYSGKSQSGSSSQGKAAEHRLAARAELLANLNALSCRLLADGLLRDGQCGDAICFHHRLAFPVLKKHESAVELVLENQRNLGVVKPRRDVRQDVPDPLVEFVA